MLIRSARSWMESASCTISFIVSAKAAIFAQRDHGGREELRIRRAAAGVSRLIYLGGLGDTRAQLSLHLRSGQKVEEALREAGVP